MHSFLSFQFSFRFYYNIFGLKCAAHPFQRKHYLTQYFSVAMATFLLTKYSLQVISVGCYKNETISKNKNGYVV